MWASTPYWRPRDAKIPSTISSFTLTESVPPRHAETLDLRPGGGVRRVELRGPVHLAIAVGIAEVLRWVRGLVGIVTPEDGRDRWNRVLGKSLS